MLKSREDFDIIYKGENRIAWNRDSSEAYNQKYERNKVN